MQTSTRLIPLEIVAARRPPHSPGCGDDMREVEFRLAALAATGKGSTIDLCRRNLRPVEYRQLQIPQDRRPPTLACCGERRA